MAEAKAHHDQDCENIEDSKDYFLDLLLGSVNQIAKSFSKKAFHFFCHILSRMIAIPRRPSFFRAKALRTGLGSFQTGVGLATLSLGQNMRCHT